MSRSLPSITHARLIARTELRRKRRAFGERSRWQLALLALIGVPGVATQTPAVLRGMGALGNVLLDAFPTVIANFPTVLIDLAQLIERTPGATAIGTGLTALVAAGVAVLAARRVIRTFEKYTL